MNRALDKLRLLDRLRLLVEIVTGVSIDADGVFTAKGADDHELDGAVGWQFGFYSRTKGGVNGVVLKADGQGNTSFLIAFRDKQYELSLKEGEVGIKNAFNASVLLDENGQVVLNGGSAKVSRVGDHGNAGTLKITAVGSGAITGTYTDPDGTVLPWSLNTDIPLKAKLTEGADKVLA